ncbi:hypothetical protein QN277_009862 [Acacia crassicarpa]|uniref:Uncharacterized protein n=1 Tax=Acacia crassicarpa TaxID=499986 RepID=A0AAE1M7A7_9FABA|nr:hypothetical protein QN277_009862 [Acacia crassicarpa]
MSPLLGLGRNWVARRSHSFVQLQPTVVRAGLTARLGRSKRSNGGKEEVEEDREGEEEDNKEEDELELGRTQGIWISLLFVPMKYFSVEKRDELD